jgi:hypothetical protein
VVRAANRLQQELDYVLQVMEIKYGGDQELSNEQFEDCKLGSGSSSSRLAI